MDPVITGRDGYSTAQPETLSEEQKSYLGWPHLNHANKRVWDNLGIPIGEPFVAAIVVLSVVAPSKEYFIAFVLFYEPPGLIHLDMHTQSYTCILCIKFDFF